MIFNQIPHAELCNRNIERIMDHFDKNINKLGFEIADDSTKSFHRKC